MVKLSSACDKNYQPLKHSTDYIYDDLIIKSTDYVQTYDLVYDEIAHNEHELSNELSTDANQSNSTKSNLNTKSNFATILKQRITTKSSKLSNSKRCNNF